ncbi:MAG: hypothetical protein AAF517_09775 [Planctomycetota bacterium]
MRLRTLLRLTIIVAIGTSLNACKSEAFIDVYGGFNVSGTSDFEHDDLAETAEVESAGAGTIGARVGTYFTTKGWFEPGLALDISSVNFSVEDPGQPDIDLDQTPISLLAMMRLPIARSARRPHGLAQPYVAVGPTLMLTDVEFPAMFAGQPIETDDTNSTTIGADLRVGLAADLTGRGGGLLGDSFSIAGFLEYRATIAEPEFDGRRSASLQTVLHHVLFGMSLRF